MVSLDAGYMQRFNPGYVRGPRSAINSVIFTNRWEFMCIFKLCSVFTPHWLIGHGRWGRARGSTNHSWRQSTNHRAGSSCLGFGQHMYCYSVILQKWMPQNENTYERQCTCCFNCALILVAVWIYRPHAEIHTQFIRFCKKNVNLLIFIFGVAIIMRLMMVWANMMLGGNNSLTIMVK